METKTINVGVLGCGNVGAALITLIDRDSAEIANRTGLRLEVTKIAVRSLSKPREVGGGAERFTTDALAMVTDPAIDLIVEVIGGIEPAREYITTALQAGKPVVTGNKELLANVGSELFGIAEDAGVDLLFEAAVAGHSGSHWSART